MRLVPAGIATLLAVGMTACGTVPDPPRAPATWADVQALPSATAGQRFAYGHAAKQFGDLTTKHVNERFAIMLDGEVISAPMINEMTAVGGLLLIGLGLILLDIKRPRVANFLPALVIAPLLVALAAALGINIYPL